MKRVERLSLVIFIATTFLCSGAHAALLGRLPATPGGMDYQAYYDTQLNITWTADANINGSAPWDDQVAWAGSLTVNGIGGWRLPSMDVDGSAGGATVVRCETATQADCLDNEYGHLFWYGEGTTLGAGITSDNPGPFSNVQASAYWSGTEATITTNAWSQVFNTTGGTGSANIKIGSRFAWAVFDGDIGEIPIPSVAWLFPAGLLAGLGGMRAQKKV